MVNQQNRPATFEYKSTARRIFDEVWGKGQLNIANELVAPNHVNHGPQLPPNLPRGPEGVKQLANLYHRAFPDSQYTIEDQMVDGDKVVTRWTVHGTQKGELFGMPPSGKRVIVTGITIDRMTDGKIAETWTNADLLGLMQQIGAVPALQVTKN